MGFQSLSGNRVQKALFSRPYGTGFVNHAVVQALKCLPTFSRPYGTKDAGRVTYGGRGYDSRGHDSRGYDSRGYDR